MSRSHLLLPLAALCFAAACADDTTTEPNDDAGAADARIVADATSAEDARTPEPDASATDAAATDAAATDAANPSDAAEPGDAGSADAAAPDATPLDAAAPDAGPVDSGVTTGSLELAVSGLPNGTTIWATVEGPNGFSQLFRQPTTIAQLEPGAYTVTALDLSLGGISFTAHVTGSPATVVAGQTARVLIEYVAPLPLITQIAPPVGRAGGYVSVRGQHLTGQPSPMVTFDGVAASVFSASDTDVSVVAPPHAVGDAIVAVTGLSGTSTVTTHAHFGYFDVVDHPVPSGVGAGVAGIALGADGNVWFTERFGNAIGRVTPAGVITEFPLPTPGADPSSITAGPDGNLWFTEYSGNQIGKITLAGVITEYALPSDHGRQPYHITSGPDGALWIAESGYDHIGRMTTSGLYTEWAVPTFNATVHQIVAGPDGALWFTEYGADQIGRITTAGVITEYPINSAGSPSAIAAGADGNLWITINSTGMGLARVTPQGVVTRFSTSQWLPTISAGGFALGRDGNLYFASADSQTGAIVRVAPDGTQTGFTISNQADSVPEHLVTGPDGNLWFCDYRAAAVRVLAY